MTIILTKCEKFWPPGSGSNHGDKQLLTILPWKEVTDLAEKGPEWSPQPPPEDPPSCRSAGASLTV